ncbi:hypothetical protein J6590_051220 [Homalodisca vitripennis]|nr:hypothetical protein J6590_051220 [Homalodisca vitripennis]
MFQNTWHQQFENRYTYIEQQQIEEQLNKNHNLVFLSQRWGDWVILQNVDLRNEKQLLGNFRVMRGSTRYAYTSFSFRKRFSFNKLFTRTIQQFLDHGLWAFWVRKFTGEDYTRKQLLVEKDVQEFNQPERLTLAKLHPAFYLLLIGLSFSSLVFSIEYLFTNGELTTTTSHIERRDKLSTDNTIVVIRTSVISPSVIAQHIQ